MMRKNLFVSAIVGFMLMTGGFAGGDLADFDDLSLGSESFWNGSDDSGGFTSGSASFSNSYDGGYWDGFAYSNITDTVTEGMAGQYNAIVGGGAGGSANYGISYVGWAGLPTMTLNSAAIVDSLSVTNNNYAFYAMSNGDAFSKKFGGVDGSDEDWFRLTITGKDSIGDVAGSVDFYLADFTFAENSQDYIVDSWESVDISSLGVIKSLEFSLSSSDVGDYGMNTPAYFAIDTVVPEPATMLLLGIGGMLLSRRKRW